MMHLGQTSSRNKLLGAVVEALKKSFWLLVERQNCRRFRLWLWRRHVLRSSKSSYEISAKAGYRDLDFHYPLFGPSQKNSTFFILGSGSSINELSEEDFDHIKEGVSIGINVWAIHPFIPSAYAFETGKSGGEPAEDTLFITDLLERRSLAADNPKFLFLRPTLPSTTANLVKAPTEGNPEQYLYGRANLTTRLSANLPRDVERILNSMTTGRTRPNVLLDNGASVVRMLVLGFLQGFTKIVLTGVDLDNRPYFWLAPDYPHATEEILRLFSRPSTLAHSTNSTENRPFTTEKAIRAVAEILTKKYGVEVFVGSKESTLSAALPSYKWPSSTGR